MNETVLQQAEQVLTATSGPHRVVVAGGPRTGKTTMAEELRQLVGLGCTVRHTDALKEELGWSEVSELVARDWFAKSGPWVVEGVAAVRALRKWLDRFDEGAGAPCELLVYLDEFVVPDLKRGQLAMAKGCWTVFDEIREELEAHGVRVFVASELAAEYDPDPDPDLDLDGCRCGTCTEDRDAGWGDAYDSDVGEDSGFCRACFEAGCETGGDCLFEEAWS